MIRSINVRFVPMRIIKMPKRTHPVTPPRERIDPDHDSCSIVNGPELNGVSCDSKSGRAGENHPQPQPNPSISTFANSQNDEKGKRWFKRIWKRMMQQTRNSRKILISCMAKCGWTACNHFDFDFWILITCTRNENFPVERYGSECCLEFYSNV